MFPSVPSMGSGRPHPAGGRKEAPRGWGRSGSNFPFLFSLAKVSSSGGTPLSGDLASSWFLASLQSAQVSTHVLNAYCMVVSACDSSLGASHV